MLPFINWNEPNTSIQHLLKQFIIFSYEKYITKNNTKSWIKITNLNGLIALN